MKIRNSALITLAAATLSITVMAPAHATTEIDEDLKQELEDARVPDSQVNNLARKIENGETLDAEKSDVGASSVEEYEEDGFDVTRFGYPDGSYVIAEVEQPVQHLDEDDVSNLQSVSQCTESSSGSWLIRNNCTISWSAQNGSFSYDMDARYIPGGAGAGQIDRVYGAAGSGLNYISGSATATTHRANGNPAIAVGQAQYYIAPTSMTFETHVTNNGINPQQPR